MKGVIWYILVLSLSTVFATPADLTNWTQVEDPPDANLGSSLTSSLATLTAGPGSVANARDIGFQSISGNTVATSSDGYYFDPAADFTVAVDFDLAFSSALGGLGLGFGIGEEGSGENSAGVGLLAVNGTVTRYAAASRIGNTTQSPVLISPLGPSSGTLLVEYTASNGNIDVGYNPVKNSTTASSSTELTGLQNSWNDQGLLVSFFIRSDASAGTAWTSGDATAEFENFRVLNGSAIAIPEPSALTLVLLALCIRMFIQKRP